MLTPRGVGQSVTECVVKALCNVKVTDSKPAGTKIQPC
jgi:ABC-type transporter Mla maintaining outer membrane lipid asymmetry permease subunit MlaE